MGFLDFLGLGGKKAPAVDNTKQAYNVTTASGSTYTIERDTSGKWWLYRKGKKQIARFSRIEYDEVDNTNFQKVKGKIIWFENKGGLGKTGNITDIQKIQKKAA